MGTRRRVIRLAVTAFWMLLALTVTLPSTAGGAAAQSAPLAGPLSLDSLTPWVGPDGVWTATFTLATPVPGATLTYTVHRPLTGDLSTQLGALGAMWDDGTVPAGLLSPVRRPLDSLTNGSIVTLTIPVRSRSDGSDRAFLPNPGLHPVEVEVTGTDGALVQRLVLPLVRAPSKVASPMRLAVVVRSVAQPPMTTQRGVAPVPSDVSDLGRLTDAVDHAAGLPITLSATPALLEALAIDGHDEALSTLDRLRSAKAAATIAWTPWVPLDIEAWSRHGQPTDVANAFAAGADTMAERVGKHPDTRAIDGDRHLGPASLKVLSDLGIDRIVVDADQVDGGAPQVPRLFTLTGERDAAVTALARADDVQAILADAEPAP